MKMRNCLKIFAFLILILQSFNSFTQDTHMKNNKMQWWEDTKFGMLINWGVYSVLAGVYNGKEIDGIGELNQDKINRNYND
jgi:alpha-L-fucosidase